MTKDKKYFLDYECKDVVLFLTDGSIISGAFYYADADEMDEEEDSVDVKIYDIIKDNKKNSLSKYKNIAMINFNISEIKNILLFPEYEKLHKKTA